MSSQISTAVVSRWILGLAGFSNWPMMIEFGISFWSSSARAIAPFIPFAPSVRTRFAPSARRTLRRSTDIVSGMVSTSGIPFAAQTKARPIPVFPEVGSMTVVMPGLMVPLWRASAIMESPILSFTEDIGLNDSSLTTTSASSPCCRWGSRTSGVLPIVSTMLS